MYLLPLLCAKTTLYHGNMDDGKDGAIKWRQLASRNSAQVRLSLIIMASPPAWTNSAVMLSTPDDLPTFSAFTAASPSSRRMGRCAVGSQVVVKVWAALCPPVKDFILFCETVPRLVLHGCTFTMFLCPWLASLLCWTLIFTLRIFHTLWIIRTNTLHYGMCEIYVRPTLRF